MVIKNIENVSDSSQMSMKEILDAVRFNPTIRYHNDNHRLSDVVYEHVLSKLVFPDNQDELRIGGKITEAEIASDLKMSNGPIRDAMVRLRREGWIITLHNRGSYVIDFTEHEKSREIYKFRLSVETGAFYTLAKTITDSQLSELKAYQIMTEKGIHDNELLAYRKADAKFHLKVIEMAGGQSLREAATPKLLQWFALSRCVLDDTFDDDRNILGKSVTHGELITMLENRDSEASADLIVNHCQYIAKLLGIEK